MSRNKRTPLNWGTCHTLSLHQLYIKVFPTINLKYLYILIIHVIKTKLLKAFKTQFPFHKFIKLHRTLVKNIILLHVT